MKNHIQRLKRLESTTAPAPFKVKPVYRMSQEDREAFRDRRKRGENLSKEEHLIFMGVEDSRPMEIVEEAVRKMQFNEEKAFTPLEEKRLQERLEAGNYDSEPELKARAEYVLKYQMVRPPHPGVLHCNEKGIPNPDRLRERLHERIREKRGTE